MLHNICLCRRFSVVFYRLVEPPYVLDPGCTLLGPEVGVAAPHCVLAAKICLRHLEALMYKIGTLHAVGRNRNSTGPVLL